VNPEHPYISSLPTSSFYELHLYPMPARQLPLLTLDFYFTLPRFSWDHTPIFCFTITLHFRTTDPHFCLPELNSLLRHRMWPRMNWLPKLHPLRKGLGEFRRRIIVSDDECEGGCSAPSCTITEDEPPVTFSGPACKNRVCSFASFHLVCGPTFYQAHLCCVGLDVTWFRDDYCLENAGGRVRKKRRT
jgi:hypothetical protein